MRMGQGARAMFGQSIASCEWMNEHEAMRACKTCFCECMLDTFQDRVVCLQPWASSVGIGR